MIKNNQKIILGIGGIAVISGALFYLNKKWKKQKKGVSYEEKYEQFCLKFYSCNQIELFRMRDSFDELFRDKLKSAINFVEIDAQLAKQNNTNNMEQKQKVCRKKLTGQYYYECLDCSIQKDNLKEINKEFHDSFDYYAFCEDCFDKEYHKGHRFKIKQTKNNVFCDCGSQFLRTSSSFCKQHCGYGQSEIDYVENLEQEKKDLVINFFQEFLHLLFEGMKKDIDSQNTIVKIIDFQRHNALFSFIIDKMKEIIKHYDPFIFCIKEVLQQPLIKHVPIEPFQNLIKEKDFEQPETVLDWLFVFNQISTERNEIQLSWVMEELAFSSLEFHLFYTKRFFKNFQLALRRIKITANSTQFYLLKIISTYRITLFPFSREEYLNEIIETNIENVLLPLKSLVQLIKEDTDGIYGIFQEDIINYFFQYFIFLVQNTSTLEKIKDKLNNLVGIITDLSYCMMINLTFTFSNTLLQDSSFFEMLISFQSYQTYEISLLKAIKYFIYSLSKLKDEQIKQQTIEKLAYKYSKGIDKMYNYISIIKNDNKQNMFYFGVSFVSLIIYIITLSQRKTFSQQVIRQGIFQSFKISEEPQLLLLICKAQYILRHFFLSFNENGLSGFLTASNNLQADFPEIAQSVPIFIERMVSSCYGIYDHYILTMQIFNLADTDNLLHTSIFYEAINYFLTANEINKFSNLNFLIYQVLFDQTPFINIFIGKHQELFLDYEENIEKQIDKVVEQTTTDIFLQNDNSKQMILPLFQQKMEKYISIIMYFKRSLDKIGFINIEEDCFQLKPEIVNQKTLVNECRCFYSLDNQTKFFEYHSSICKYVFDKNNFFDSQLLHQKEILFNVFLNPKLNEQLLNLLKQKPMLMTLPTMQTYLCTVVQMLLQYQEKKEELSLLQQQECILVIQMYIESETFSELIQILNNALNSPKMQIEMYQSTLLQSLVEKFISIKNEYQDQ